MPSYRRPALLSACLDGLAAQGRPADEIIVVHRPDDHETGDIAEHHPVRPARVEVALPGFVAALRAGAACADADVIAFTDDDAVPRADWIERLSDTFTAHPEVGAVGGRDMLAHDPIADQQRVGVFGSLGRLTGGHHKGLGTGRYVDTLKGVNMAFRKAALALPGPALLQGTGVEMHSEIAVCAWASKRGWRIWYDPTIVVDHEVGPRFGDQRIRQSTATTRAIAHNLALTTGLYRGFLRQLFWLLVVGRRGSPGIILAIVAVGQRRFDELGRLPACLFGYIHGALRGLTGAKQLMIPHDRLRAEAARYGRRTDPAGRRAEGVSR